MGRGYKHGSGGGSASLNFKIVGGTTQPGSPAENTIWVNTDEPITSYIFSAAEPEVPTEGMVWVKTGTSSTVTFNALKKNGIEVYPLSAKQYVSGAWVDKTAQIYQGGKWVEWTRYLLSADGFISELGGMISHGENGRKITFSPISTGGVLAQATSTNIGYIAAFSTNAYDFTDFKIMRIKTGAVNTNYIHIGISTINDRVINSSQLVAKVTLAANSEIVLDISGCSGNYYLAIVMDYFGYAYSAELLEITLE